VIVLSLFYRFFDSLITGLHEGHYTINIYYQYDFEYYDPDSLYYRGSIEVDFFKTGIIQNNAKKIPGFCVNLGKRFEWA